MLTGLAHIGVHQQCLLTQLREHNRKIGCGVAATIASRCTYYSEPLSIEAIAEPAQQQLAAQGPKRFDLNAERTVRSDNLRQDRALTVHDIRITELQRHSALDLVARDQAQL